MRKSYRRAPRSKAFFVGALVGSLVGVVLTLSDVFFSQTNSMDLSIVSLASFVVGMLIARNEKTIHSGSMAGLWTAFFASLVSFFIAALFNVLHIPTRISSTILVFDGNAKDNITFFIVVLLVIILASGLTVAIGAGAGAIGGIIGKKCSSAQFELI
ncbi:hypothetical protein [Tengunoibacter tsumagoiensis]|uniref:Uncharacterized protein n=1 Tax=Tengunoibacter tsumagoiensis TaxID=2014871 RepID=A0A401ZZ86_9CHLR|nr:hypothetical protein [Tengunoibacter tsumagoiensis]GCE12160.1 hypothetical protein KTT_20190 [Tengunoibacter tsumagoiensis]